MKKEVGYWVLGGAVFLVLVSFVYFYFNGYSDCKDDKCFFDKLASCEKAHYVYYGNITFDYVIKGVENNFCVVDVTLLRSYWRGNTFTDLNGKSMECFIEVGDTNYPEQDIDNCHGPLKEGLQEIILDKLNSYLLDNFGLQ